jgi:hypothetical protein
VNRQHGSFKTHQSRWLYTRPESESVLLFHMKSDEQRLSREIACETSRGFRSGSCDRNPENLASTVVLADTAFLPLPCKDHGNWDVMTWSDAGPCISASGQNSRRMQSATLPCDHCESLARDRLSQEVLLSPAYRHTCVDSTDEQHSHGRT